MGEGAKDLGAGIMTAGKALGANAAQQAEAERKIAAVRGQVALTAKGLARGSAIARDTDPVGMVARHVNEAAEEVEQVAQRVSDPQMRSDILLHRDSHVADAVQRVERRRGVLDAQGGVTHVVEDGDALRDSALESPDPSAMNRAADVFHTYVDTLREVGWVDDTKAADIKRTWATGVAERALLQASPEDRVAAIAAIKSEGGREGAGEAVAAEPANPDAPASADGQRAEGVQPRAASDLTQLARMLPAEVLERIDLESQAEIGRTKATRVWEKARQYEDAMEKASRGEPQPAPWRAAIEADPDLDDRTRARLLQKHDSMQRKLDRFWSIKAEYDKRNGRRFDVNDANDRTFVEQMYTRLGADDAALHAVVNRSGIFPDAALNDMKGRLNSKDPTKVAQAMADVGRLTASFPLLLALSGESADDLQNALSEFRYYGQSGTQDQAIKRFIESRTSTRTVMGADLTGAHVDAAIIRATPVSHFSRAFGDNPAVTRTVIFAYRNLVKQRYAETGDLNLAKAQADGHMKPLLDAAAKDAARKDSGYRPGWFDRAWLNGLDGYYRGTVRGAGNLRELHDIAREVESTPPEAMEKLLFKLYPGLKNVGWRERIESELQLLKSAPERYRKILADLKRYDEMKGSDSVSEFGAAAAGQIAASMLSPESYAGWSVKGTSWVVRAMKAAIQQGGIAGAADLATQWNLIEAGEQREFSGWRTVGAAAAGLATGAIAGKNGRATGERLGITPEGPPKQQGVAPEVKVDEPEVTADASAPVAPKTDAPDVGTLEGPGTSAAKVEASAPGLPPSSEAQAGLPQEASATSSVSGEKAPGPILAEGQSPKADAQGVAPQEVPGSPVSKSDESASSASTSEARTVVPQETLAPSSVSGEKDPSKVSAQSQAPKPTRWEQIDLDKHESADGKYHTIKKHVGKGFEYLQDRLNRETWIPRASSYLDKKQADYSVNMIIENCADDIAKWLADPKSGPRRVFKYSIPVDNPGYMPTGFVLGRKDKHIVSGTGALVFIEKDVGMPNGFRIVTSYPIP